MLVRAFGRLTQWRVPARALREIRRLVRLSIPLMLLADAARPAAGWRRRARSAGLLVGYWAAIYRLYRRDGIAQTDREWQLLRTATPEAFDRHYNECVPTVAEEFDLWGEYHAYRHNMRYDLVGQAVREHLPSGGRVLDIGSGAALVADRISDVEATYVGVEYGGHQLDYAVEKSAQRPQAQLRQAFVRGDAEHLPFADSTFDVVVMSEVIEHLLRPEIATWELARVLRRGGVFVMTTNNASEMPLRSPLSHLFAWLEKAIGFRCDGLISHRPWVWPRPVAKAAQPDGSESDVWLPHTWHKQAETRRMFAAAGLDTLSAATFEFPPPQSATSRWLSTKGRGGELAVDLIEAVCRRLPLVNRLGCHVLMVARRVPGGLAAPPPGVWPGPFSAEPAGRVATHSTSVR